MEQQLMTIPNVNLLPEVTLEDAQRMAETGKSLVVSDQKSADGAGEIMVNLDNRLREIEGARKEQTSKIDEFKNRIMAYYRPTTDALKDALTNVKEQIGKWHRDEAEKQRKLAEARAAEEQRKQREKLKEQATKAREKGKVETAAALKEVHDATPTHVVHTPAKVKGAGVRKPWKGRVTDLEKLVKAIAEGKAPIALIKIDQTALNKMAGAMKQTMKYPGVEAYEDIQVVKQRGAV